jgi:hypothetical protein
MFVKHRPCSLFGVVLLDHDGAVAACGVFDKKETVPGLEVVIVGAGG